MENHVNENTVKPNIVVIFSESFWNIDQLEEVKFNKPEQPNAWYSGLTRPDESLGKDGDYYFDTQHEEIYLKEIVDVKLNICI